MATDRTCPSCGRELAADAPQGLCPECLMKVGFGTDAAPQPGEPSAQVPFTPPSLAELAKLFPHLQILELVGRGGMGAVYCARQPALERYVALKVLPPQATQKSGFAQRFTREARALARLNHPNIVAVHDFGEAGGMPYFVMEFVEGVTLRRLVQQHRLGPREALQIVPQICEALQYAHDEGVVHRDIKPENILIDRKGRVKIADFGIAKIVAGDQVRQALTEGQVLGTPHYMAPEQIEHPQTVDHRADIYSLGVVFYEMLTGELPLGKFAPPSLKVEVDVRLDEVVLRALEKEPEHRYQHASEVKTAVETIAAAGNVGASATAHSTKNTPEEPSHWHGPPPSGPSGRWQFNLLPNLLSGERVLHFQKRLGATLWKSLPNYRLNVSWPPLSEVGLYVTDRRVIVVTHILRLMTHEFSIWFPRAAPSVADEVFKRVITDRSRWFGPYVDLISEHPEKRWHRSRELRLRLYVREPEALETLISSASSEAQAAPGQPQQAVHKTGATPKLFPCWLGWAQWTARITGTLILLTFALFVLAEGLPPFARQPGGVQLTSAGGLLILLGFVVGWWREGTAAVLIALGWTVIRAAEIDLRVTTPFEIALLVSLLYASVWWATQGRKTVIAGSVAATLALGLVLGRLFAPTGICIEGVVHDAATRRPIPNAELKLFRYFKLDDPSVTTTTRTSQSGRFSLYVGWYASYKQLNVSADGYAAVQSTLGARPLGKRRLNRDFELVTLNRAMEAQPTFGAVRDLVVTEAIDLDKGTLAAPSWSTNSDLGLRIAENVHLAELDGVDAYVQGSDLFGLSTTLTRLPGASWAMVNPSEVHAMLAVAATNTSPLVVMEGSDNGGNVYAFKTREGSTGVLQITKLAEGTRGVRIRYKLARLDPARQAPAVYETVPVTRGPLTMIVLEGGRLTPFAGDPAQWQVDATLPETSVAHIEVGQEVDCQADAYPGRVFKGKVIRIDEAPKPGSQPTRYHAVVQVTNPGLKFRDGMSVRLAFILAHRPAALRIPVQALSFRLSGNATVSADLPSGLSPNELAMPDAAERAARTVWVIRGKNDPEPVPIRIGITDNAFTEVTSGLREGERVVIGKTTTSSETQSDRQAELAPRKNTNTSGFAPAIERVLRAKEECFLDLDTGQTHGPAIIGRESDLPAGMDLSIPFTPVGAEFRADRVVALDHLEVQPATSADWSASPDQLRQRMEAFESRVVGGLSPKELGNRQSELPKTYLFRTSQWSEGVLEIVAFTPDPPGVKLRYKFLVRLIDRTTMHNPTGIVTKIYPLKLGEAGRLLGTTKSLIGAAGEVVSDERSNSIIVTASPSLQEAVAQLLQQSRALEPFSPVIDRFLDFDTRKPTAYLDLDTGQYLDRAYTFPFGVDSTPPGMDLRTSDYESDTNARLAINMALKPVATNRWDATPAEIRKELAMTRRQAQVRLVTSETPQLFFFRTSEGGQGILQLQLGPTVDGRHQVHIRYKLLSPSAPGKASAFGDGADAYEKQIAPAGETRVSKTVRVSSWYEVAEAPRSFQSTTRSAKPAANNWKLRRPAGTRCVWAIARIMREVHWGIIATAK